MIRKTEKGIRYSTKRYEKLEKDFMKISNDIFKITNSAYQIAIYTYLCLRHNTDYDYAFPSIKTISKDTSVSVSKVKSTLKELEELGLIKKDRLQQQGYQEYANNIYYIYYPIVKEEKEILPRLTDEQLKSIEEGEKDYFIRKEEEEEEE